MTRRTTTLKIGKKAAAFACSRRERGMTLIEVLVSVVILSAGIVLAYKPLLTSVSALHHAEYRMIAHHLIKDRLWEIEESFLRTKRFPDALQAQTLPFEQKVFFNTARIHALPSYGQLYQVDAVLSWKDARGIGSIKRTRYVDLV